MTSPDRYRVTWKGLIDLVGMETCRCIWLHFEFVDDMCVCHDCGTVYSLEEVVERLVVSPVLVSAAQAD